MKVSIEIRRPGWMTPPRLRRARPLVLLLALVFAGPVLATDRFGDVEDTNPHHDDISAIAAVGITQGCNPPVNDMYCPEQVVTRQQMGSFLARTAGLGTNPPVTNADKLDGLDSTDFYADGAKVDDSELLDGIDSAAFQRRVTGTCVAGSAIRVVNANGTVTCESDDVDGGDADTLDGKSADELVRAALVEIQVTTPVGTANATYGTALSITAPSGGYVVLNSNVAIQNDVCTGNCVVSMWIRHIQSDDASLVAIEDLVGARYASFGNSNVFSVSAGINTFDILIRRELGGNGTLNAISGEMNAVFVPFGSTGGGIASAASGTASTEP